MAADGQIVLGLNVSATTAQISADLSTILDGLGTKQLILKAAIEKSQVEKSVASLVKEINQETAKIGIEVDPKSVSKVISQQQKMASMQKELVQQMDRYKQAASDVGLTLKGATQNSFKSAIDANDFKTAKESLRSVKKEIEEYNVAIKKMNEDTKLDFDIQNIQSKFTVLKNQTDSVKTLFKQLEQSQENFNNATSNSQKLQYYNELKSVIGQLENEYSVLKQSESALAIDSGIKKQMQDMDTYVKNLKATYSTIGDSAGAEKLKNAIQELDAVLQNVNRNAVGGELATEWEAVTEKVNAAKRAVSEYRAEQSVIGKKVNILDSISEKARTMKLNIDTSDINGAGITELSNKFDELGSKAQQLKAKLQNLDPSDGEDVQNLTAEVKELQNEFANLSKSANVFKDTTSIQKFTVDIEKARSKVADYANTYSAIKSRPDLMQDLEKLQATAANISTPAELKNFNSEFDTFNSKVIQAGAHCKSFGDQVKQAFQNFSAFFSASRVIYQVIDSIKQMVDNVIQLNTAMVELKKVSNATDEQYDTFLTNAKSNAVDLGSTVTDLVNATSSFSRLGYSLKESEELGKVATIYANVGDDVDNIDQATTSLISTMKGFGIEAEDSLSIVDKFNEIGNKFAISSGGIGDALQRSAAAFDAANNTIDESIALVVAANNVIQDPDTVGNMWKTVTMRIRGAKTELEEAGLETEYMAESTSSLREAIKGLTNVDGLGGFDIMKDEKTFKSTYDIILGIGEVWKEMSDIDQAALLELLAGKRQGNALAATLTNLDDLKAALEASKNAAGSAMEEQEVWLGSLEAKINQFKASFESLSSTVVNEDLVGAIIDFGTNFIHTIDNVINSLGGLGNSLMILVDIIALLNFNKAAGLIQSFWNSLKTGFGIVPKITGLVKNVKNAFSLMSEGAAVGGNKITQFANALTGMNGAAVASTAAIMGVVAVISIAVMAYKNWKQAQEEARKAVIDTGNEAAEHANNLIELADSYFALADAVDAGTAAKEDMLAAQDDIIKALGLEGQSVDELIAKYGDLNTAIKTITLEQLDTDISQAIKGAKTAKSDVIGDLETWKGTGSITSNIDTEKAIIKWLYDQGLTTSEDTVSLPHSDYWDLFSDPSFEDLKENRDFLEKAMNAVRKEFGSDSDVFNRLSDAYDNYADALDPAVEAIDNANKLIAQYYVAAARGIDDPKTKGEFEQFKQNIIEQLNSDFDFDDNGSFTAEGLVDSILQSDRLYSQFYQSVEDALQNTETSVQAHGNKIKDILSNLWNAEGFADTKKSILELANSLDGITADNINDLASSSGELAALLEQDGMSARFLAHILQTEAMGGDGFALITDDALKLNESLEGLRGRFDEVTDAKTRYDAAMKAPEKDTDFKSYAAAFKELNEQFVAGTTNSNAFWAAAEYLFGEDQLQEWGWSEGLDKIYEAMKKNVSIFKDADSAGSGFLDKLYAMSEAGEIKADDGSVIAEIKKLSDGSYDFQFDSANLDALADKLGITSEAALACMEALSMYGDFNFYDIDAVMKAVEEIGLASDSIDGTAVNVGTLTDQLISLGYTNKDIYDLLNVLREVDGVTLLDANANVETLVQSLSNLGIAAQDGVEVTINADGLAELMSQLNFTKEDTQGFITKLGEADNITLTNAQGKVVDLNDALKKTDELKFASVTSELDGIMDSANLAQKAVDDLQKSINTLKGRTVTVTVDVQRKNGILGGIFGYAKGTSDAPEGDALVGEKGEELVQSGDRAYLVGTNGPEITHLNEGDIVYTAEQTKKIKRGSTVIKGVIPAYAGGTINPNKGSKKGYKSVLPSSKSSRSTKKAETEFEHLYKYHQHLLAMDQEQVADYLQWLDSAYKAAYEKGEIELDDYYKYEEEVFEKIKSILDDVRKEHENAIKLNQNWLNNAIDDKDFEGITKYTAEIVNHYRAMQEEVHKQAEYYRSLGYSDTSDEVSKLSDLWWKYYDAIAETSANAWQQVVDNANDAVDEITGLYDTLKDAAQEYADSGFITIDTLQEICSWGIQYLAYLKDENGQLVINEESLQRVIAARTEQMAVETALSYVQQIRSAIERNEITELMNLTLATEQTTTATWDLVYAQLRLLNVSGDLNDTMYAGALQNINNLRALSGIAISSIGKVEGSVKEANESAKKALKEQGDYLDDLLKYVMEMIKQEVKNQIDGIEKQIDNMKEIVDLQKKSLDLEREKDKYTKNVADKTKELAKLQQQLALLELDDSRESAAKQAKLKEEIADLSNDLADDQTDHAYDATSDMLDDMYDAYEKEKKKEIETLENTISSEEKVYRLAIERIQTQWDTLYQQLLDWNYEYGTVTNNEITAAWDAACAAVQKYGSYLEAVLQTQQQLAALEASSSSSSTVIGGGLGTTGTPNIIGNTGNYDTSGGKETENAHNIIKRMYANSQAWASSSPEKRTAMHEENKSLAAQLSRYGINAVTDGSSWYVDRIGGALLYDKYRKYTYHKGGIVGDDSTLKQDEVFAKLKTGEAVFTEEQQKPIYQALDFAETMLGKYGKVLSSISGSDLMGIRMQEQIKQDTQQAQTVVENSGVSNEFNLTFPVQVLQKLNDAEIHELTSKISKYTINELDEVFNLRGKRSFRR